MRRSPHAVLLLAFAVAATLLAPQAASAAVTCSFDAGGHGMFVTLAADQDEAKIATRPDGALLVNDASCGGAAVNSVDGIYVSDASGGHATVELDATAGSFAPGATFEGLSSEIEIYVDLGSGLDRLVVVGEAYGAGIAAGTGGVNLNAATDAYGGDIDLKTAGVEYLTITGGPAHDLLTGQGGAGTGAPYDQLLELDGAGGDDELHGGGNQVGKTFLDGGDGDDLVVAGLHGGFLSGGPGTDTLTGGPGIDKADYEQATVAVHVDLAKSGPQDTGEGIDTLAGVDWIIGSPYDDVLAGDDAVNRLFGLGGDDALSGRGGTDDLYGDAGADTLRPGLGDDSLAGGADVDTAAYDDAPAAVTIDLGATGPQAVGGGRTQTLAEVEGVVGSPFADHLIGSAGANLLDGGGGGDTLAGGAGPDRLRGGAGSDAIDARDGVRDEVACGERPDSLTVDAIDALAADCSAPAPVPGPGGAGSGGGTAAPVLTAAVPRQSLRAVRRHGLRVTLSCGSACTAAGRLALTRATARRLGLRTRRAGELGSVALAPATPRAVRVELRRATRRALRGARRVGLVLRVGATGADGAAAAPVSIRVRPRAR